MLSCLAPTLAIYAFSACGSTVTIEDVVSVRNFGDIHYVSVMRQPLEESYLMACIDKEKRNKQDGILEVDRAYLSEISFPDVKHEFLERYFYEDKDGRTCMFARVEVKE